MSWTHCLVALPNKIINKVNGVLPMLNHEMKNGNPEVGPDNGKVRKASGSFLLSYGQLHAANCDPRFANLRLGIHRRTGPFSNRQGRSANGHRAQYNPHLRLCNPYCPSAVERIVPAPMVVGNAPR